MGWIRRWGAYVALTVVFAVACGLLSTWQWARREEAVTRIERVEANYDAAPVAIDRLLDGLDDTAPDAEWHPVELVGEYLVDEQLLVRNRPRAGRPGYEVLVPFRLEDGTVVVVDRGWLPDGATAEGPDAVPAPPSGEITVIARLRPGEPVIPGRGAPEGQLATIHLPAVAELVDAPTYTGMYGQLVREKPPAAETPAAAVRPADDEGPHLSYALQWIAFGVLAFIGLFWAIRRERRIAALPPEEREAARRPDRRSRDADEEDAILDAAER